MPKFTTFHHNSPLNVGLENDAVKRFLAENRCYLLKKQASALLAVTGSFDYSEILEWDLPPHASHRKIHKSRRLHDLNENNVDIQALRCRGRPLFVLLGHT